MIHADEKHFLAECRKRCRPNGTEWPRDVYRDIGMNWKRACYLLQKWADKKIYSYGVTVDLGWFDTRRNSDGL